MLRHPAEDPGHSAAASQRGKGALKTIGEAGVS